MFEERSGSSRRRHRDSHDVTSNPERPSFSSAGGIEQVDIIFGELNRRLSEIQLLNQIAQAVHLKPIHIPLIFISFTFLFFGVFEDFILGIVGFFYPAWESFKAIENPSPESAKQWLTYWVVYSFFSLLEVFSDFLLFWIPFYYVLKVLFLAWLFLPQYKGATKIYQTLLRPLLITHRDHVDAMIARVAAAGVNIFTGAAGVAGTEGERPRSQ